jgi:hypothetical protein
LWGFLVCVVILFFFIFMRSKRNVRWGSLSSLTTWNSFRFEVSWSSKTTSMRLLLKQQHREVVCLHSGVQRCGVT